MSGTCPKHPLMANKHQSRRISRALAKPGYKACSYLSNYPIQTIYLCVPLIHTFSSRTIHLIYNLTQLLPYLSFLSILFTSHQRTKIFRQPKKQHQKTDKKKNQNTHKNENKNKIKNKNKNIKQGEDKPKHTYNKITTNGK